MELTRRVNLNDRSERRAMKKLIKREQKAGNIAKGVSARESVKAMREAQNNYGQFFDETGHVWQPTEVEQVKAEPQMLGVPQIPVPDQISLGKVFQEPPTKKKLINRSAPVPVEQHSKLNPHPKYNDVPNPYIPEKVKTMVQPQHREWYQYGVGSNAVPDKTPAEIEADRKEMNDRVKNTLRQWLYKIPLYRNIDSSDLQA